MAYEIEFRVWDKTLGQFVQFNQLCHFFSDDTLEFSMYTGLKNENNEKIFEGDLVNYYKWQDNWSSPRGLEGIKKSEIKRDPERGGFIIEWEYDRKAQNYILLDEESAFHCVIQGNIYQNDNKTKL